MSASRIALVWIVREIRPYLARDLRNQFHSGKYKSWMYTTSRVSSFDLGRERASAMDAEGVGYTGWLSNRGGKPCALHVHSSDLSRFVSTGAIDWGSGSKCAHTADVGRVRSATKVHTQYNIKAKTRGPGCDWALSRLYALVTYNIRSLLTRGLDRESTVRSNT